MQMMQITERIANEDAKCYNDNVYILKCKAKKTQFEI